MNLRELDTVFWREVVSANCEIELYHYKYLPKKPVNANLFFSVNHQLYRQYFAAR